LDGAVFIYLNTGTVPPFGSVGPTSPTANLDLRVDHNRPATAPAVHTPPQPIRSARCASLIRR